ncbi:short-chain dehydrogenase/reductase SDR [Oceanithermus profundus DSM 14977]|uniref:Short-chain dehydrogenase/reductase SDR n=1 Tax=Oceanithermus profundus (strain DSM 14977 / NBRC 100410 / VKM B-2274 / 506) TaxID=670487 RepID=E4U7C4_OCEP5|nr:SDR family NAD(P)-dependent oxidoreductase [Oceanithermus profundus]ADR36253.1 short-chain dehydrogenase/reductase SDR [Oceanithermus profundus DSM 14977]
MPSLRGRTLILTGASRGIGRALALGLAERGAHLVLTARGEEALAEVAREVEAKGVQVRHHAGDVAAAETARRLVELARELGRFYGFVHNAGVLHAGPLLWELPERHWNEVLGASLTGAYQLTRFALPDLIAAGDGVAVYVGSGAAEYNLPGIGAYAIAKAAEEHLARQVAAEAPMVASFAYRPGVVDTGMQEQARSATGGAAEQLHEIFGGYKEKGVLISPEQAANYLVRVLEADPHRYTGTVYDWRKE